MMTSLAERKTHLEERRAELVARLAQVEDALDDPLPRDLEDQALELDDDEVQLSLGAVSALELKKVEAALARIEDATYGECLNCGEQISEARLDAVPHATLCIKCAN
jgi:RNA polymerase-binding protein DksA